MDHGQAPLPLIVKWRDLAQEGRFYNWRDAAGHWAKLLKVAPSTILAARRGDTWKHLKHSNAGRQKEN